ncbi:MAG: glycosyltransferase family 2 protein [Prevotella sp.]|nr:glycosyltransferase family 2 protein [Prevotella sp.]
MKKLTIVIVNYNVKYYVEQCIRSVKRATEGIDAEVYVVDNHSHDGSVEYLRPLFPDVTFIESNHNLGFSRANNIAISQSESKYVLLLNPDTIVGEDAIRHSVDFMDAHPDAGAVGVKMLYGNGIKAKESRRGVPTPLTSFYKMCGLCARYPQHPKYGKYYMGYLPWDKPSEIEIVSGACLMVRRNAIEEIGLMDEDYFMYGEDIDLSYRLLQKGWHNWYLPATILHYKGESTEKSSFRYVHVFYDAMLIFLRKHFGYLGFWITIPVKIAIFFKAFIEMISMFLKFMRKSLGFNILRKKDYPDYVFIGKKENLAKCELLARKKGITVQYVEGDSLTCPDGHLQFPRMMSARKLTYIIYDTTAYSMQQIFAVMEKSANHLIQLGTFYPDRNIIITDQEILT